MINLTIHPNYISRSTTRAKWKAIFRAYRMDRRHNREMENHMADSLRYAFLPEKTRREIEDRLINPPIVVGEYFLRT